MAQKRFADFQDQVETYLIRHKSIMDASTKLQESSARVNRAIAKAVTECGCISIRAERQTFPEDVTLEEIGQFTKTHIAGELCANCREVIESELGMSLFYTTALCSILDLAMDDVVEKEYDRLRTLGVFNLT